VESGLPQNLEEILLFMEQQEIIERNKIPPKLKEHKPKNNKRKSPDHGGGSQKRAKKHCELCAKKKEPANTHNANECRRYNPDGSKK
jgi:Asp-tRNA(Asn)/Glu-tRNA(Gln) amidotransferase C subunit